MEFEPTSLPGVILVKPKIFRDDRGFFLESYNEKKFSEGGLGVSFVQDNHVGSKRGALRGLHSQRSKPQGKLIRVVEGEIFDVAVDIRLGSPTFGKWFGTTLSAESLHQLYIPPDFAHGYCVLSEHSQVEYKCTNLYDPASEFGIRWDDPEIGIDWPLKDPILSKKDAVLPSLAELKDRLPSYPVPSGKSS
ncbi:MAG: dTDP-4-dehydrorhamnose 3,5-epimerase [Elusimicrobiota bacterium]